MSWNSAFNYPPPEDGKPGYLIYDKIMISGIICLLLVAFFVFLLNVYTRWFREPPDTFSRRTPRRSASTDRQFHFTGEEPARLLNVGLDSAILETLPMFVYKSKNFTDGLDCAVCLCEFEEDEKARLLPNCRHSFHVECIDMWFRSHSTCPLCRTRAQPEQSVLESVRMEQVSATIPRPIPSGIHDILNSEERQTASSGEEYNLSNQTNIFSCECGDKQINRGMDEGSSGGRRELTRMPHIAIEIMPKRPDCLLSPGEGHFISSPNGSQSSSKSPVTRLRSLTKMFNRDRETKVVPCDIPAECDAENNEL